MECINKTTLANVVQLWQDEVPVATSEPVEEVQTDAPNTKPESTNAAQLLYEKCITDVTQQLEGKNKLVKCICTGNLELDKGKLLQMIDPLFFTSDDVTFAELPEKQKQKLGKFKDFCPVSLSNRNQLVKGSEEFCQRIYGSLYLFASAEAVTLFKFNHAKYLAPPTKFVPKIWVQGILKQQLLSQITELERVPKIHVTEEFVGNLAEQPEYAWIKQKLAQLVLPPKASSEEEAAPDPEQVAQQKQQAICLIVKELLAQKPFSTNGALFDNHPETITQCEMLLANGVAPDVLILSKIDEATFISNNAATRMQQMKQERKVKFLANKKKLDEKKLKLKRKRKGLLVLL